MEGLSYLGYLNGVSLMEFTNEISGGVVMSFFFIWKSVPESVPYLFHILITILKHILLKTLFVSMTTLLIWSQRILTAYLLTNLLIHGAESLSSQEVLS